MISGKNTPTLDQRLNATASHVGKTKATLSNKLDKRAICLAQRQPTNEDWDNWFHYNTAVHRNQNYNEMAFEITPTDKAQAELDSAREIEAHIQDDLDGDPTSRSTNSQKRKRQVSPNTRSHSETYCIPKKDQYYQRDYPRDSQSRSTNNNQDFGRTRPSQDHKQVYYNNRHQRPDNRDGRDNFSSRNRDNSAPGNRDSSSSRGRPRSYQQRQERGRDPDTDRKINDLQHQLDLLKRH